MIISFGDSTTEALFRGQQDARVRRIPPDVKSAVLRKLDMLNAAAQLVDLRVPPGNRLELLQGELNGFHSIRVNDQWRLIFIWSPNGPTRVRLVDYH